jgi:hypothetical protein
MWGHKMFWWRWGRVGHVRHRPLPDFIFNQVFRVFAPDEIPLCVLRYLLCASENLESPEPERLDGTTLRTARRLNVFESGL